jgi:hypothetical protein
MRESSRSRRFISAPAIHAHCLPLYCSPAGGLRVWARMASATGLPRSCNRLLIPFRPDHASRHAGAMSRSLCASGGAAGSKKKRNAVRRAHESRCKRSDRFAATMTGWRSLPGETARTPGLRGPTAFTRTALRYFPASPHGACYAPRAAAGFHYFFLLRVLPASGTACCSPRGGPDLPPAKHAGGRLSARRTAANGGVRCAVRRAHEESLFSEHRRSKPNQPACPGIQNPMPDCFSRALLAAVVSQKGKQRPHPAALYFCRCRHCSCRDPTLFH